MTSSAHQPFASRSTYVSGKFPDRSLNPNPAPFNTASLSRHRTFGGGNPGTGDFVTDTGKPAQQPPQPPAHSQGHGQSQEPVNPLNRLTDEQREEINEAVRHFSFFYPLCFLLPLKLCGYSFISDLVVFLIASNTFLCNSLLYSI
jgi:hypothetical protein